jgi:hypothetical protein
MDFLRSAAELKEHFRALTTICDAFIKPAVNRQTRSISKRLQDDNVGATSWCASALKVKACENENRHPNLTNAENSEKNLI